MSERPNKFEVVYVHPHEARMLEAQGYVRDRDFVLYSCLKCEKDMDRCECTKKR